MSSKKSEIVQLLLQKKQILIELLIGILNDTNLNISIQEEHRTPWILWKNWSAFLIKKYRSTINNYSYGHIGVNDDYDYPENFEIITTLYLVYNNKK